MKVLVLALLFVLQPPATASDSATSTQQKTVTQQKPVENPAWTRFEKDYGLAWRTWKNKKATAAGQAAFWRRAEKLVEQGVGRARMWLLTNIDDALPQKERAAIMRRLFSAIVAQDANATWIVELTGQFSFVCHVVGKKVAHPQMRRLLAKCRNNAALPELTFCYARELEAEAGSVSAESAEAVKLYRSFLARWPKHRLGERVSGKIFHAERLQIGKHIPELRGRDIDGKKLSLSDFAGRVTVIDFWGFW